jgi:hypothetical protein
LPHIFARVFSVNIKNLTLFFFANSFIDFHFASFIKNSLAARLNRLTSFSGAFDNGGVGLINLSAGLISINHFSVILSPLSTSTQKST